MTKPQTQRETNTTEAVQAKKKDRFCKVLDKAAINSERTHELRNLEGTLEPFTFKPRKHMPIPYSFAVSLLGNDGFEVLDENNKVLRPMRQRGEVDLMALSHDEVIAKLSELRPEALIVRAKALPGGDNFVKGEVDYEDLVEFILAGGTHVEPKPGELVLGPNRAGPAPSQAA